MVGDVNLFLSGDLRTLCESMTTKNDLETEDEDPEGHAEVEIMIAGAYVRSTTRDGIADAKISSRNRVQTKRIRLTGTTSHVALRNRTMVGPSAGDGGGSARRFEFAFVCVTFGYPPYTSSMPHHRVERAQYQAL
jgi:hypothetical protein